MDDRFGQAVPNRKTRKRLPLTGHPYREFADSPTWRSVEAALTALVRNGDLELMTQKEYVIGYICKRLKESNSTSA